MASTPATICRLALGLGVCGQTGRACPRPPQPATKREGRVTPEMSPSQGDPAGPLGDGSKVSLPGPLGPEKVQVSQPGHGHPGSPPGPRSGARGCRGPILSREAPGSGLRVGSQLGQAWETGSRRPALYHISHPTDEGGTGPREAGQPGEAWAGEGGLGLLGPGPRRHPTRPLSRNRHHLPRPTLGLSTTWALGAAAGGRPSPRELPGPWLGRTGQQRSRGRPAPGPRPSGGPTLTGSPAPARACLRGILGLLSAESAGQGAGPGRPLLGWRGGAPSPGAAAQ